MSSKLIKLPSSFRKMVVHRMTHKFREAVRIETVSTMHPGPNEVLVKNRYVGINASDINYTAGRYDTAAHPPFDVGFEGVGEVVATGEGCQHLKPGMPVAYTKFGAFADYTFVPAKNAFPLPEAKPEYVALLVSGLTAALALDKVGEIRSGETVLVTAAAGGTGQFAVQWAKAAGCHVIGTCSTDEKVEFLHSIGCDRPINYSKENLNKVLRKEYPKGVDVVYESVGGEVFDTCVNRLAEKGRLIIIGFIAGYESDMGITYTKAQTIPAKLLSKSASLRGFFMNHFFSDFKEYLPKLVNLVSSGKLQSVTDNGINSTKGPFRGIDSVIDAIDYLYSRKSKGKIIVEFPATESKL